MQKAPTLTAAESAALIEKIFLPTGRLSFVGLLEGGKLTCSERAGDLIHATDPALAMKLYEAAGPADSGAWAKFQRHQNERQALHMAEQQQQQQQHMV